MNACVVDVCDTLVKGDTTIGLLKFHFTRLHRYRIKFFVFHVFSSKISPFYLLFTLSEKLLRRQLFKYFIVGLLSGERKSCLDDSALIYAKYLRRNCLLKPVSRWIADVSDHDKIILASESLEPIVKALADSMNVKYVASTLEVRDGICTGRYLLDITGEKETAIIRKYGFEVLSQPFSMVTDNISDYGFLMASSFPCVVLHKSSRRSAFARLNPFYITVD